MSDRSLAPSINVTIGQHTRVYFAFVTTAPITLDSPATVTLHGGTFSELAGFAADPITFDDTRAACLRVWCSWTRWSSPGNERSTAATNTSCSPRIRGWSA